MNLKLDNDDVIMTGKSTEPAVTISTIHAAKGLEWHTVFIPDCHEGNLPFLPDAQSATDSDQIEEERRIFYVALTRGIHQVYLCSSASFCWRARSSSYC